MNEDMRAREVPNWMLYDLMRDMREDIADLDTRLRSVEAKLEAKIDKNTERIEGLYLSQNKVKVGFSRTFALANMVFSGLVAYVTVLFTGEYQA